MKGKRSSIPEAAFSRLELLFVLLALGLVAVLALPALANTKTRSQRVACVDNLREIGHALHVWGNDRGNKTPCRTSVAEGGTFGTISPFKNNAWFQWSSISNELQTPKLLVCPADRNVGASRMVANNWSGSDRFGGYATIGFRDTATSYTVALDAFFDQPGSILSGDRNVQTGGLNSGCSSGVGNAYFYERRGILRDVSFAAAWTNAIHFQSGNVLLYDGQVEQVSNPGLNAVLNTPYPDVDNGSLHLLIPN